MNVAPASISTSQEPDLDCSENIMITKQNCHENNPNPSSQPEATGNDDRRYRLATETLVADNTAHPPSSTNISQVITPDHEMSSTEHAETVKDARIKLLFPLDDKVKTNLVNFHANDPNARTTQRDPDNLDLEEEETYLGNTSD